MLPEDVGVQGARLPADLPRRCAERGAGTCSPALRAAGRGREARRGAVPVPAVVRGQPGQRRLPARAGRALAWPVAVEFRGGGWMEEEQAGAHARAAARTRVRPTWWWTSRRDSRRRCRRWSRPPQPDLAMISFHGHNAENWEKQGITAAERFRYLYDEDELREWVAPARELAGKVEAAPRPDEQLLRGLRRAQRSADAAAAVAARDIRIAGSRVRFSGARPRARARASPGPRACAPRPTGSGRRGRAAPRCRRAEEVDERAGLARDQLCRRRRPPSGRCSAVSHAVEARGRHIAERHRDRAHDAHPVDRALELLRATGAIHSGRADSKPDHLEPVSPPASGSSGSPFSSRPPCRVAR